MEKPSERLVTRLIGERILPALNYTVRPAADGGIIIDSPAENSPRAVSAYGVLDLLSARHIAYIVDGTTITLDAR